MRHIWVAFVLVFALVTPAHAVDWSAYIDTSAPARAQKAPAPAKTSRTQAGTRGTKKVASKAKAKSKVKARAKAKRKARR